MAFAAGQEHLLQFNSHYFDFNIQFEQIVFSILPSALFILASSWRSMSQARKAPIVGATGFQTVKSTTIAVYAVLEVTLLTLASNGSFGISPVFIAASALKVPVALLMATTSVLDHSRSPRPSVLLSVYLLATLFFDAIQARTLFLLSRNNAEIIYSSTFTAAVAVKLVILVLEAQHKSAWIRWNKSEHSPEESSGIYSLGVYWWLNEMFRTGFSKILGMDDLYPLDVAMKSTPLHDTFRNKSHGHKLEGDKYGLAKLLARTLTLPLLLTVLPRVAILALSISQPLFLERLTIYLSTSHPNESEGYALIFACFLIYIGQAIAYAYYHYFFDRARTMTRAILVAAIFDKATKSRIGVDDNTAAVSLMSTDIERIMLGVRASNEVWACTVQIALTAWLLYARVGLVFLFPIGLAISSSVALIFLMGFGGPSMSKWMDEGQKRVGLTATVINCMKSVKLSGLAGAVQEYVQQLRVQELFVGGHWRKVIVGALILGFIPQQVAPPLVFGFTPSTLDPATVFTALSFLTLLTMPLAALFEQVPSMFSAFGCLGRIQAFLELESHRDYRQYQEYELDSPDGPFADQMPVLEMKDASFGWEKDNYVLRNINAHILGSQLTMIIGPVGSGKSTLCKAMLGEIPFHEGSVTIADATGRIAFCEQGPILWNDSVKHNIVGYSPFDQQRYNEVIRATELIADFATLEQGDETVVGSDGVSLSGGQKQRVSLARALYLQADILVLDDVFSGLDAKTERRVFQNVFSTDGLLRRRGSTVVLCTNNMKYLPAADHILSLQDGTIAEAGSFRQLTTSGGYVQRLKLSSDDHKSQSEESMHEDTEHDPVEAASEQPETLIVTAPDARRRNGDMRLYARYAQSMGWPTAALGLLLGILWSFFGNFTTIWLSFWSADVSSQDPKQPKAYYASVYALLQLLGLASMLLMAFVLWVVAIKRSGGNLHRDALHTLIRAPLSFFTSTDTGATTNLFSQDLNLVDTDLPNAVVDTIYHVFFAAGSACVMLTSSPYLGIAYPFVGVLMYFLGRFYLRTSRQLRLLDLEAKSPLYTHFLDTVKGIATLRAFGYLPEEIQKNAHLLDTSQRPAYLLFMIQNWLSVVLALVVMVIAVILVTLAVVLQSSSAFAGASLFALLSFSDTLSGCILYFSRLETSMGAIARLEAFSRDVRSENRLEESVVPQETWPEKGVVVLQGVNASYQTQSQLEISPPKLALRDVTMRIGSGEKVAICGRTGSGKSSLVSLLLKLLDPLPSCLSNPSGGEISIDDIPLRSLGRAALRDRSSGVPQETVFLPGGATFTANIDPSGNASLADCEAALVAVGLWDFVAERGGLEAGMNPETLSAGQKQLFSMGRALLRRQLRTAHSSSSDSGTAGGILLLDEVSSNVDRETERRMQEIIREEFRGYTVIAVSHRLEMIMDFDRVVVMDLGQIIEVGVPRTLAHEIGSKFGELVRADGNGSKALS